MQSFNLEAICYTPQSLVNIRECIPHYKVKDIAKINPEKLYELGIKGLVFDKDNTLTAPYSNKIYPAIASAFEEFKYWFEDNIVILSNSAGTCDDPQNVDALTIERDLGIKVILHDAKKPGGIYSLMKYFNSDLKLGINPSDLAMFGDRVLTDVVFGNRHEMLTIYVQPFTSMNDNFFATCSRGFERWLSKGKAKYHPKYNENVLIR